MSSPSLGELVLDRSLILQLCVALVIYKIIRLALYLRVRQRRYKLFKYYGIPGPDQNLFNGNHTDYRQDLAHFRVDPEFRRKYGKTYGIFIGDDPQIMSTDLELLRRVFLDNIDSFRNRINLFIDTPLSDSILFTRYERWKLMRKLMAPTFSAFKIRGQDSMQFIEDSLGQMLKYIERKFETSASREGTIELDVQDLMKATALHAISHMAINLPKVEVKENESHVKSLNDFLDKTGDGVVDLVIQYPFLRGVMEFFAAHFEYDAALKLINSSLRKTIDEGLAGRRQKRTSSEQTLIDLLIKLHRQGVLTREEVIANCQAILIAGYDTTSTTLTYLFWVLAKHAHVQQKLRAELQIYGVESSYLAQVLDETMRLYPTVITFASRVATETVQLPSGFVIPKGTRVNYNAWLINRDADIWPEPFKFEPERFAPGNELHPCAFAPFGLGARRCLAMQLAKLEMKMIVCDVLLRYKIHLLAPTELDLITHTDLLSKPREKVLLKLEKL